jgi:hypothetical protein
VNQESQPLVLSAPVGDNRLFAAELRTNVPGQEFELHIRTMPPLNSSPPSGHFTLRTSSTNQPELRVTAYLQMLETASPRTEAHKEEWWTKPLSDSSATSKQ